MTMERHAVTFSMRVTPRQPTLTLTTPFEREEPKVFASPITIG